MQTILSPATLRRAADIKEQLEAAQAELASLFGEIPDATAFLAAPEPVPGRKVHWASTPEGRAKLARRMRKSWK